VKNGIALYLSGFAITLLWVIKFDPMFVYKIIFYFLMPFSTTGFIVKSVVH